MILVYHSAKSFCDNSVFPKAFSTSLSIYIDILKKTVAWSVKFCRKVFFYNIFSVGLGKSISKTDRIFLANISSVGERPESVFGFGVIL